MHEFNVAVAGEADRNVIEERLHVGMDFFQIVVVRIGQDQFRYFFLAANEIEGLFFTGNVAHAALQKGFFVRRDIGDIDDVPRIDVQALAIGAALAEDLIGQVKGNGIPEQRAAALIFGDVAAVKADDVLVRLFKKMEGLQDAVNGAKAPTRAGHELDALFDRLGNGFDIALTNRRVAAEQCFIHVTSNDFIVIHGLLSFNKY
ncbi:hypothetical protein HMPREF3201_01146 [Megasphaera sp. MJR8396C]|nr:hypothetical protein HMPREF3201_01146 [Megasphaera sp. MJR8396C]